MSIDVPPKGTRGSKGPPTGAMGRVVMSVARRVHKLTGDKMSGQPLLHLHTLGAKSGQPRTAVVVAFPEGDDAWLIVASRGGSPQNPSWLYNLAAHPDKIEVEIKGRRTAATAETLAGEDHAAAWARITGEMPRFTEYEQKTDRQIPVVRLRAS